MRYLPLASLLTPLLLTACATPQPFAPPIPTAETNTACIAFSRMTFDRLNDTLPTIAQIKAYDAARDSLCGNGK